MLRKYTPNVSPAGEFLDYAKDQVVSGRYRYATEAVRSALRRFAKESAWSEIPFIA
jgi:Arc/MetJ-type ribon-helix-helix transcriptional regulator